MDGTARGLVVLIFCSLLAESPVIGSADEALPQQGPKQLTASIYTRDGHQLLYHFKRVTEQTNSKVRVLREYTSPAGEPAVREKAFYEGGSLKAYSFDDLQTGAQGSAVVEPDPNDRSRSFLVFHYRKNASDPNASELSREPMTEDTLVDDMVGFFLASHWERLASGRSLRCKFAVIPRRETIGFSFKKDSESTWRGQGVIILKMQPSNPFIAAVVEPLYFTVEKDPPHRVLQYVGRTTPKIFQKGSWRDLEALTVFEW